MSGAKTRFLDAGHRLFRRQGYAATGLKALIQDAAAPSGSLYHYFPEGKAQLGVEVIAYAAALYAEGLRTAFARTDDPIDAVRRIFRGEIRTLEQSDYRDGCPIASVTGDVASASEPLRLACADAFSSWLAAIAEGFARAGIEAAQARALAAFFLSAFEGAIILSRASKSTEPLRQTGELVADALESRLRLLRAGSRDEAGAQ